MMMKAILLVCVAAMAATAAHAKALKELKFDLANLDTDKVNCESSSLDIIDECGLQQGNSYIFDEFAYPTNRTSLEASCRRQTDAFKCLRAYSKCLSPLPKQVLQALVSSRQRFNKKVCSEKPTDFSGSFIELGQCMRQHPEAHQKAAAAETNSIIFPEAITATRIDQLKERIKQSCCSVAKVRREFLEATQPHCKEHTQTASEVIDSYLTDTVGIICPNTPTEAECDKLPRLNTPKKSSHHFFIKPIINVIETLQPK